MRKASTAVAKATDNIATCTRTGPMTDGFWALFKAHKANDVTVKGQTVPVHQTKFFVCELDCSEFLNQEFDESELKLLGIKFK